MNFAMRVTNNRIVITPEIDDDFLWIADFLRIRFPDLIITPYATIAGYDNKGRAIKGKSEVRIDADATPELFVKTRDAIEGRDS